MKRVIYIGVIVLVVVVGIGYSVQEPTVKKKAVPVVVEKKAAPVVQEKAEPAVKKVKRFKRRRNHPLRRTRAD